MLYDFSNNFLRMFQRSKLKQQKLYANRKKELLYQLRIQKKTNDEFCAINFCDNDKIPVPRVQGETPVLCAVTNSDI